MGFCVGGTSSKAALDHQKKAGAKESGKSNSPMPRDQPSILFWNLTNRREAAEAWESQAKSGEGESNSD